MLSSYCIPLFIVIVWANIIYATKSSNELSEEEAFLAQMKAIPPTILEAYNFEDDSSYDQYQKRSTTAEMTEGEAQRDIRSPLGTMRFGKRSPLGTMRFGKRNPLGTMRFGKRSPLGTMRFGKRDVNQFERNPLGTMRFGKRSAFVNF
jgi:hypothetical protein